MNKKLALKISKHPLIKKLMEDRTIPNSVIANLIVEEITEAAGKPTLASALMGVERDLKNGPEKFLKKYNEQKKFYSSLDQLPERQQEMYKQIVDGYIKAFLAQQKPETEAKGEELEKKVDDTMNKILDADSEDKEGQLDQDSGDDSILQKIQDKAENASEYLSYASLGSAGLAVSIPPSAPVTFAASKLAGWAGTAMDVVALGAAIANDDKEGIKANGIAAGIGVSMLFVPGGEGWKLLGKETGKETIKVISKETGQLVAKEVSKEVAEELGKDIVKGVTEKALAAATQKAAVRAATKTVANSALTQSAKKTYGKIKDLKAQEKFKAKDGTEYTKEQLKKLGEEAILKAGNKIEKQVSGKKGEEVNKEIEAAAKEVGLFDKFKKFFGFGTDSEDKEGQLDQDSGDDERYIKFVNTYKDEMKTFDGREKQALYLLTVELNKNLPKNISEDAFTMLTQGFANLVPQEQDALLKQSIDALDEETKKVLVGIVNDVNKKLAALKIIRHALDLEAPKSQTEPEANEQLQKIKKLQAFIEKEENKDKMFIKRSDGGYSKIRNVFYVPSRKSMIDLDGELPKEITDQSGWSDKIIAKTAGITAESYYMVVYFEPEILKEDLEQLKNKVFADETISSLTQSGDFVVKPPTSKEPSSDQETAPDEAGENEDPEKFDVDPEALQDLIRVSEEFIEEFYEKALLRDQGKLVRNVLDQLVKITEKEELEKAAQRRSQPKPEEEEQVQEQQQNPSALRNIQVDLKSFIKLAKRSKEVLQRFDEASDKGKVIGSSLKKKFMEMLAQLQENIRDLVQDISKLNLVQEAKDTSEIEKKWDAIEKGYNDASRALSNIIAAGSEEKEAFDMENNVKDAYNALMSISHFFPSVNPFGKKTSQDMKKYSEQYEAAIKDVKSVLRDVLELSQGQGGRSTASNAIKALKEFSGQIQSIFDVKSKFDDVIVQPNERAAQGEPQPQVEKEKSYADILTDKVLSFLANLISKAKNKKDIQSDIEKQAALDEKQKEILSSIVAKFELTALQEEAKMTPEEMKLYIQLLIALEEKRIVKLSEAPQTGQEIFSKIKNVINEKFPQDKQMLLDILKKEGVISHLQSILKDVEYDANLSPEDEQGIDFSFLDHKPGTWGGEAEKEEEYPPHPKDTRYLSREEVKLIEGDYLDEAKQKFYKQIQEATRKHYKEIGRKFLPSDGMPFVSDLAALKMVNQKQKTATAEENNKALENMDSAKNIIDAADPFNIADIENFEQFLGDPNEYKDYKGSKKIIASYLAIKLNRYNKIIDFIGNETLKSIKEYINEEPKKKKNIQYTSPEQKELHQANLKFLDDIGELEEKISRKIKPLIREMLNKGK